MLAGQLRCRVRWETPHYLPKARPDTEMDGHTPNKRSVMGGGEEMDALLEGGNVCMLVILEGWGDYSAIILKGK